VGSISGLQMRTTVECKYFFMMASSPTNYKNPPQSPFYKGG
jgi:hypothetical protein